MYFKSNNISIYYEKYGENKDSLLILPGWGDNRKTFNSIINNLKNNYTIYIFDYPSFGNSPIPDKDLNLDDYTKIIIDFINKKKIININIIAHSFGGRITSLLIGKYNIKVKKLVLIDVAGIKRFNIKLFLKIKLYKLLKLLCNILPKNKRISIKQKLFSTFSSNDYKDIPKRMIKTFQNIVNIDLRSYYKNISNDTLIIWGEKDNITTLKDGKYLNRIIKNSALIKYKNANHFSYLDYPLLTNNILSIYLKKD